MKKTFTTMKTNVGNSVQDTSSAMLTLIGGYINDRLTEVFRRAKHCLQPHLSSTTVAVTAGTQNYALSNTIGEIISVVDTTNNRQLSSLTAQEWVDKYSDSLTGASTVEGYILTMDMGDTYSVPIKTLKLVQTPASDLSLLLFYVPAQVTLSSDSDYPELDCSDVLEAGATADAWRYKRQNAKAQDFEAIFEKRLATYIWDLESNTNRVPMMNPKPYSRNIV